MNEKNNSRLYNFSDFTYAHYRRLLAIAKNRYIFRTFTDFSRSEPFIIWRHDVDFSVHAARNLARIEADAGIKTVYFFLFHSEFYNLLEKEIIDIIKEIIGLGHEIGLHFDCSCYNIKDEQALERYLTMEKNIFAQMFSYKIKAFSFHLSVPPVPSFKRPRYGGLISVNSEYFCSQVGYCSDSNGIWRHRRLHDVLSRGEDKRLHVLTHPEWWRSKIMSPWQRVLYCIDGRARKTQRCYKNILIKTKRKDIDWI